MFLAAPVVESLQVPFLAIRDIYEIRERHSRIYSWTAMLTSQFLAEIPWNILGSTLFLACWYWTAGFPSGRAGYTFLLFGVIYPLYYTSFGQVSFLPHFLYLQLLIHCGVGDGGNVTEL